MTDPTAAHVWGCTAIDCEGECRAAPSPRQDPEPQELRGPVAGFKISLAKCAELRQAGKCVGVSCVECEANVERAARPSSLPPLPSREEVEKAINAFGDASFDLGLASGKGHATLASPVRARAALLKLIPCRTEDDRG